jgi:hypothetical protein
MRNIEGVARFLGNLHESTPVLLVKLPQLELKSLTIAGCTFHKITQMGVVASQRV